MTTPTTAPGYRRVKMLKATTYAREALERGAVVVVDETTAAQWLKAKRAVPVVDDPAPSMIRTTCPRCGSALEYPETPAPHERWTQCQNPACGFGWLR